MGNYHISIEGVGAHHNANNPQDADKMANVFVGLLKSAGHSITSASITCGSKTDLPGERESNLVVETKQAE